MRILGLLAFSWIFPLSTPTVSASSVVHHDLKVVLTPERHRIDVVDQVRVGERIAPSTGALLFLLHEGLNPISLTPGVEIAPSTIPLRIKAASEKVKLSTYQVVFTQGGPREFTLSYGGEIHYPLSEPEQEYGRGFRDTPGLISEEGIYLASSSAWYPQFPEIADEMVTFSLEATVPAHWDVVTQGDRTEHRNTDAGTVSRWKVSNPQDEIYLIGGTFTEYEKSFGPLKTMAFLRAPDPELANKYLEATGKYLKLYEELIGPYAYGKFALVENFWETGYGMPSFTLLGSKVIRFPFILTSSYPHEILHNWWGNGVYVNYRLGNWCEGLTAYLADHLMKEQSGGAVDYRRATLQKYLDFVSENNDFPLSKFTERHNPATEAVGYGKALMLYHMLRMELGDEAFVRGLRKFYSDRLHQRASFDDIRVALEAVSGRALGHEFETWVNRAGAPELRVQDVLATALPNGAYEVSGGLTQVQAGEGYDLQVPVAVSYFDAGGAPKAFQTRLEMNGKATTFRLTIPGKPYQLSVDPEFDLFRKLDRLEVPPSFGQAFGAKKALIVVSSNESPDLKKAYWDLAQAWKQSALQGESEVVWDKDLSTLPQDRSVWIIGAGTRFRGELVRGLAPYDVEWSDQGFRIGEKRFERAGRSTVLSMRHPQNVQEVVVWVTVDPLAAMEGVERKLPHYGKYSYLVLEGDEPKAVAQGIWPTVGSPMSVPVKQPDGSVLVGPQVRLAPRNALAALPSGFSQERMMGSVRTLSAPEFGGRELGSPELMQVSELLARQLREGGLKPIFQDWRQDVALLGRSIDLRNVVAVIPGKNPAFAGQSIVLGAHYDHLGKGVPDAAAGNRGKIHPGADDNASGVAVLLELARHYADAARNGAGPDRTLVFALFTGEESGLLGSKRFVQARAELGLDRIFAMVNLDTVGRLFGKKLMVIGAGSAREWAPIFHGIGAVTGVPIEISAEDLRSSDHASFFDIQAPAIQLFSGPNEDYHRPSDTAEKIDGAGLVKVAQVTKEALDYLLSRKEALTWTLTPCAPGSNCGGNADQPARKVYMGTMPDFGFAGPGVRIASVTQGSPADKAGLRAGDVIRGMNDRSIDTLKAYSDFLKTLKAGDQVLVRFLREEAERVVTVTVIDR